MSPPASGRAAPIAERGIDSPTPHRFGTGRPFSIGLEEELFLVDPVTGRQTNSSDGVLARVGDVDGQVERELHACMVELITGVHATAGDAAQALRGLRAAVRATGAGILGAGTHPSAAEGEAEITDKERYERIHYLLGDAVVTPVSGLHVHVGMPDPETAIRVFNGLRSYLPLLHAVSANSPFRHGRDTGLASARETTIRGWPRSGVPRALRDFTDFCEMSEAVSRAADVPDYTWFWWKVRPHPRMGTVEVRVLDSQTTVEDIAVVAALVHCLAGALAERAQDVEPAPEILDESIFRAARFGVRAELIGADREHHPVPALLAPTIAELRDHAVTLGCEAELAALPEFVRRGGGAGRQREINDVAGIDAVARTLARLTSAT